MLIQITLQIISVIAGAFCGYSYAKINFLKRIRGVLDETIELSVKNGKIINGLKEKNPDELNEKTAKEVYDLNKEMGKTEGMLYAIKKINGYE